MPSFSNPATTSGLFVVFDTDGEVIFATASTPTHLVFNSLLNMNCACFRLRHQYQMWPRAINSSNPYRRFADTPVQLNARLSRAQADAARKAELFKQIREKEAELQKAKSTIRLMDEQ